MSKRVIKYFVSLFLLLAVAFIAIKVKGKQQQISQTSEPVSRSETIVHEENTDTAIQLEIKEDEEPESIVQTVIDTVQDEVVQEALEPVQIEENKIDEEGSYTDKDNVALYIHTYGTKKPQNPWVGRQAKRYHHLLLEKASVETGLVIMKVFYQRKRAVHIMNVT